MVGKNMTIDKLAIIVEGGFDRADKRIDQLETKMDKKFDDVYIRLDRIENLLLQDHLNRIERLEDSVRQLKTKTGIA